MTHEDVKKTGAAAKYLQGGLSEQEREEFEEHLFDCPECAGVVQADLILKARGEVGWNDEATEEDDEEESAGSVLGSSLLEWGGLHPRISAAALMAASFALLLAGYQNVFVIPELRQMIARLSQPRPLTEVPLMRSVRSQVQGIEVPGDCLHISLGMPLSGQEDFPAYLSEVVGDSKSSSFEVAHPAPQDYVLRFLVSCSDLPPDKYTLYLYGMQQGERVLIDRIRFEVGRE